MRYYAYTQAIPGRSGCRRLRQGKSALRRKNGAPIGMQRIGWLIAQPDLDSVPNWLPGAVWVKECDTNACCAGEHIIIERPDAPDKAPILPPDAIAR